LERFFAGLKPYVPIRKATAKADPYGMTNKKSKDNDNSKSKDNSNGKSKDNRRSFDSVIALQ
jgi:hypothetical protein